MSQKNSIKIQNLILNHTINEINTVKKNIENSNSENNINNKVQKNKSFISMDELIEKKKNIIHQYYFIIYHNYHKEINGRIYCIYSINDIWYNFIGKDCRLDTNTLKGLLSFLNMCKYEWTITNNNYNEFLNIEKSLNSIDSIQTWCLLFYKYKNKSTSLLNQIVENCAILKIKNNKKDSSIFLLNNNNKTIDSNWYHYLIKKYDQYGGIFPTTPKKFILFFKVIWDKVSDNDTIEISYILLNILGGLSIDYNAYCLSDFIFHNKDIIFNYNDWIL